MSIHLATISICLSFIAMESNAGEPKIIRGRIVDHAGDACSHATVSAFWGANGLTWDQFEAIPDSEFERRLQNEGKMEPWGETRVVTDSQGRFSIPAPERARALMAYDRERLHGAIIRFDPRQPDANIEVSLGPLVRIFGTNRLAGMEGPLKVTTTRLNLAYDKEDPLNRTGISLCSSIRSRFEFLVPPGIYELSASSVDPPSATIEARSITVTAGVVDLNLGDLVLRPRVGGVQNLIDRAKAKGTWADYRQNFGKVPPAWHLTDAKGVARDAKLSDFKGKWAVLYFWGPNCAPCLGVHLPELMAFYEAHAAQRDEFVILAFCCDFSETIPDIATLEQQLRDVRKAVWGGKNLPFPVLLDNTFQTYERFGLEGNGISNTLLINPEGKLIEGDLKTLERELHHPDGRSK